MENYILFIAIVSATIASPGPGVVLTITNAIKDGFLGAVSGVFGVAIAMLCIAVISATSLAAILSTSALSFTILKYIGSAYLIYLGIKMWRSSSNFNVSNNNSTKNHKKKFTEGFLITLLNPKPIFFFMALFPQFINPNEAYIFQFLLLAITFSVLVVIIHFSPGILSGQGTCIGMQRSNIWTLYLMKKMPCMGSSVLLSPIGWPLGRIRARKP